MYVCLGKTRLRYNFLVFKLKKGQIATFVCLSISPSLTVSVCVLSKQGDLVSVQSFVTGGYSLTAVIAGFLSVRVLI